MLFIKSTAEASGLLTSVGSLGEEEGVEMSWGNSQMNEGKCLVLLPPFRFALARVAFAGRRGAAELASPWESEIIESFHVFLATLDTE